MDIWDPSRMFLRYYRVCADIREAAAFADSPESARRGIGSTIGKPVAVSTVVFHKCYGLELEFLPRSLNRRKAMDANMP